MIALSDPHGFSLVTTGLLEIYNCVTVDISWLTIVLNTERKWTAIRNTIAKCQMNFWCTQIERYHFSSCQWIAWDNHGQGDPIYRFPCDHGFQVGNCAGTRWTFVTNDSLKYGRVVTAIRNTITNSWGFIRWASPVVSLSCQWIAWDNHVQGDPIYRFPCDHGFQVWKCAGTRWTFVDNDSLKYGRVMDCYTQYYYQL